MAQQVLQLHDILALFTKHPGVEAMSSLLSSHTSPVIIEGLRGSAAPVMLAAMIEQSKTARTFLFVLNDEEEAGYFYHDLVQLLGDKDVLFFPSSFRRAVKYAQRDAANEILRTEVLTRLLHARVPRDCGTRKSHSPKKEKPDAPLLIVTHPAAIAEKVASREQMDSRTINISANGSYDLTQLTHRLQDIGFARRDYVYEPGEFAVRGSILDIFSYSSEYPFRIDFFGDDVDSIRTFEVQTQLSRDRREEVSIVPYTESVAESLIAFTSLLPADTTLVVRNLPYVAENIQRIYDEGFSRQALAEQEATSEMEAAERHERLCSSSVLATGESVLRGLLPLQRFELSPKAPSADAATRHTSSASAPAATINFHTSPQPIFHKNFDLVRDALMQNHTKGYRTYVLADSDKQNERLKDILSEITHSDQSLFTPVHLTLHAGFTDETGHIALFTDHQIFDRFHKYNLRSDHARNTKMALTLKEIRQFEPGDYVVHVDHGIGKFAGLVRMPGADGTMQEMIKLTYQNEDAVYVSIHSLHKVSKYKGKDGTPPRLSHLGSGAWEKLKSRTKKKLKDIARDLIQLYSRRREERGFAFSPDSFMQHELEAGFAYEDTPDQLKVTQQVKADMERPRPMDRLVCGDVGFGKTEIAIRAAFKAACDNKQVAVLVPTTVLALQHYKTFASRLKDFPVRVDYLSRARTAAQTKAILKDLGEGGINIIVGTHKLIGKSVKFHDLGLLIIDEEQKFGVSVKEKLRQLKVNVDTLTMSATPIPRTLQFSLMGARDLSVIQTPPPNRHPIQTEIHTFGHEIIAEAINFEMSRNGQTFIVTNRIAALDNIKNLIHKYVPDARVCTGHGQMPPEQLEQVILDFINHEYDVLISTTIVENGIDIPNANTIIIDAAHHFGLSDLHQMRGRVGRGNRKAFCYLLAPPLSLLPDESRRRLQAIENFSDLGSGIHIAMQDLDIRGAGNLLGAEQSGFIADLGYETYQKILAEAVSELKNDEFSDLFAEELAQAETFADSTFVAETSVECDLHAYFPETYVPGSSERMLLYRELDGLTSDEQIAQFRQRMTDRFGPLPPEGEDLLRIVPLRRMAQQAGVERLVLKNSRMTLYFVANAQSPFYTSKAFERVINYATGHYRRCELAEQKGKRLMRVKEVGSVEEALLVMRQIRGEQ